MKILIVGLGSIGKRHAGILKATTDAEMIALRTYRGQEENDLGIRELNSWAQVDQHRFDFALITNPTFLHIETALECAKRNMHLFIEKPIDCKQDGLEELIQIVNEKRLTAYVAYPFRFHPVIEELKNKLRGQKILHSRVVSTSYMPNWRSKQNHEVSYSSFREQGGGVLLDLSHEIDYVEHLFGEIHDIQGVFGKSADVTVDAEDFCDLIINHPSGSTNLHMNLFSQKTQRYLEVDTEDFFMRGDLFNFQITVKKGSDESVLSFKADPDVIYRSQTRYFLDRLGQNQIQNDLVTAAKLFKKIIQFRNGKEYSGHSLR